MLNLSKCWGNIVNVRQKTSDLKKAYKSPLAFVLFTIILLLIVIVNIEKEIPETKTHYIEPPETEIHIGFTNLREPRYLPIYTGEGRYVIRAKFSCFWKFIGLWDECQEANYYHTLVIAKNPRTENLLDSEGQPHFYIRAGTNQPVKSMVNYSSHSSSSSNSECKQEEHKTLLCAVAEDLTDSSVDKIDEIKLHQLIGSVQLKFSEVRSKMEKFAETVNLQKHSYNPTNQNCNTVASQFINHIGLDSGEILKTPRYAKGPVVFPGWELPDGYKFSATEPLYRVILPHE